MKKAVFFAFLALSVLLPSLSACQAAPSTSQTSTLLKVTAIESFLGDITRNVAGSRAQVDTLIPLGIDPHEFEPTPQDVVKLAQAQVIIANGAGLETWLQKTIANAGEHASVIYASDGLPPRAGAPGSSNEDPHFWMDPNNIIRYVENIRDALAQADPQGKDAYAQNAAAYISQLQSLDAWIRQQVSAVPPEQRVMVTNHDEFGYFADRYGFHVLGTIIPGFSTGSSPSAQQLAALVDKIKAAHTVAVFLDNGVNPQLADEIGRETGVKVVTGLLTHSVTSSGGTAATYIDMLRFDVNAIVGALK